MKSTLGCSSAPTMVYKVENSKTMTFRVWLNPIGLFLSRELYFPHMLSRADASYNTFESDLYRQR